MSDPAQIHAAIAAAGYPVLSVTEVSGALHVDAGFARFGIRHDGDPLPQILSWYERAKEAGGRFSQ